MHPPRARGRKNKLPSSLSSNPKKLHTIFILHFTMKWKTDPGATPSSRVSPVRLNRFLFLLPSLAQALGKVESLEGDPPVVSRGGVNPSSESWVLPAGEIIRQERRSPEDHTRRHSVEATTMGEDKSSIIVSVPPTNPGGSSSNGTSGVNLLLSGSPGSSGSALPAPGLRPATAGKQFKELGEMASQEGQPARIATPDPSLVDWVPGVGKMYGHEQRMSEIHNGLRYPTVEVARTGMVTSSESGSSTRKGNDGSVNGRDGIQLLFFW